MLNTLPAYFSNYFFCLVSPFLICFILITVWCLITVEFNGVIPN